LETIHIGASCLHAVGNYDILYFVLNCLYINKEEMRK